MNRFSPSIFLNALVITFVTLHLLIAFGDETLHSFFHNDVHSEHPYSEEQGSTTAQSNKKAADRQRPLSHTSRNTTPYPTTLLNTDASVILSSHIGCLSTVKLRI
jgi:hypothetical protein